MLHAKLRNRTCQGLDRQGQGQGQGLTSLRYISRWCFWFFTSASNGRERSLAVGTRVHVSDGAKRSHRIARIAFSVFSSRVTATTDADITAQQINGERNVFGLRAIGLLYTVDTVDRVTLAYVMWSVCQATDKLTQTNRKTNRVYSAQFCRSQY